MDLGSMVCTPRHPDCPRCPLQQACIAYQQDEVERYPELSAKRAFVKTDHVTVVLWDNKRRKVLVTQRPAKGQWAGLWEFPRVEQSPTEESSTAAKRAVNAFTTQPFHMKGPSLTLRHGIMHYRVTLTCFEAELVSPATLGGPPDSPARWVLLSDLPTLPFSSPQRRIVTWILKQSGANRRSKPKSTRTRFPR